MTFECDLGPIAGRGVREIVVPAPPGKGWTWFGGENDGQLHGPLRVTALLLDAGGKRDQEKCELLEVRCRTLCPADRSLRMRARESAEGARLHVTISNMAPAAVKATLSWDARTWDKQTLACGCRSVTLPANGKPVELTVAAPRGRHRFLETEFTVSAPGQRALAVQVTRVTMPAMREDKKLDPSSLFGMGVYLCRFPNTRGGLADMNYAAGLAAAAGCKWVREEFHWAHIEKERGRFDWSFYDRLVECTHTHGISVYGLLGYWTPWTRPYTRKGIEDYCRFVQAVVGRYKDRIKHWEVWNEPNIFFWAGPKAMYTQLLNAAYAAIKAADPRAEVLGMSVAGVDQGFIRARMKEKARFDILTIHPYRNNLDDEVLLRDLREVSELVKRPDGARRQVWNTEMGWGTQQVHESEACAFEPVTRREQACRLARVYIDCLVSGAVQNMSWYDFRDDGVDPYEWEHNLGILTHDWKPKPAYVAYATVTRMLKGKVHVPGTPTIWNATEWRFKDPDGRNPVIVLLSGAGDRVIELPAKKDMVLTDLMGQQTRIRHANGTVRFSLLASTPIFLTECVSKK